MDLSDNGCIFVLAREAIALHAYVDGKRKDGSPKYAIGGGHNSPHVQPGDTCTVKEAFTYFHEDVAARVADLNRWFKDVVLTQYEFDALFARYYQGGVDDILGDKDKGITGLRKFILDNDPFGLAIEWVQRCETEDHQKLKGLLLRVSRELCLYLAGEYGDLSRVPIFRGPPKGPNKVPMEWYTIQPGDL